MIQPFLAWIFTQEKGKHMFIQRLYMKVRSSLICSSPQQETAQTSISKWLEKTVVYPQEEIVLSNKNKSTTDTSYTVVDSEVFMLSERMQTKREHTLEFHLCRILRNASYLWLTESRSLAAWELGGGKGGRDYNGTWENWAECGIRSLSWLWN